MRIRRILSIAALAMFLFVCACGTSGAEQEDIAPPRLTREEEKIAVLSEESPLFERRTGRNGAPFDCVFLPENIVFGEGKADLRLTKTADGYGGAEYRTRQKFSYGFFSVSMKAAKCSGVISSFFTYTGWPWDEIDIEFLGKDTTEIQFNYYTRGQGGHEFLYSLGFDGSETFHEYAFLWLPDSITWYVDGRAVHRATEDIPSADAQIMMNVWNCKGNDGWSGKFDESFLPVGASYEWVGYSPYAAKS